MDLKIGDLINLRHFSNYTNLVARINEIDEPNIILECNKIRRDNTINIGDPLVLIYNSTLGIIIKGCIVSELKKDEEKLLVKLDENCSGKSKRAFERYPVSFDCDIKLQNETKRHYSLIKDISKYGFRIFSTVNIPVEQKIEVSPYLNKKMVFVNGIVVRKFKRELYYEYGINVDSDDIHSVQELSGIIKMAQEDYVQSFISSDDRKKQMIINYELAYDTAENKVMFESPKNLDDATGKLENILKRMRY